MFLFIYTIIIYESHVKKDHMCMPEKLPSWHDRFERYKFIIMKLKENAFILLYKKSEETFCLRAQKKSFAMKNV